MPTLQVKTLSAEQVWASPDGQKVIYKVGLEYNGNEVQAKTYSRSIAKTGWQGTVETYEKQGRNGSETFVKQPQKEGGWQGGSSGGGQAAVGRSVAEPQANYTMYLSYAKDLAVAMLKNGELDEAKYGAVLEAVTAGGKTLYEGREGAPKPEPKGDEVLIENIDKIFKEEDEPWQEPPQLPV